MAAYQELSAARVDVAPAQSAELASAQSGVAGDSEQGGYGVVGVLHVVGEHAVLAGLQGWTLARL